jgi:hypothetical protein
MSIALLFMLYAQHLIEESGCHEQVQSVMLTIDLGGGLHGVNSDGHWIDGHSTGGGHSILGHFGSGV